MTHHHEKEEENYVNLFYIVGLLSGLFTGVVIDNGLILTLILGVVGLLFTAFFVKLLVSGREDS